MERRRRKYDPRPKKIVRAEGTYWVPNPGVTEHFLDQRLKELGRQQTMYENEFKRGQREIQKELINIRAKDQRCNYRNQPRRALSNARHGERRRSSITDTIEKYKAKRTDQEYLNDMLRQKRDSIINYFDPNTHDYNGRGYGSQTRLNQYDDTSYPVYKQVAPTSRELPPGRTILDEMRSALEVAEHEHDEDIACGRRRWYDSSARDYIYDIGRAGYERVKDNRNIIRDIRRPERKSSYQNKTSKYRNINRPQRILLDEETSVVQVNFRRKNPTYTKDQSYSLSPVSECRSKTSVSLRRNSVERRREDPIPKNEIPLAATFSKSSFGDGEPVKQSNRNSDTNKFGTEQSRLKSEQQKSSVEPAALLKQKTYAGSPSPIGIFRERALTSADLSKRRRNGDAKASLDKPYENPQAKENTVQISDDNRPCSITSDQPQLETNNTEKINETNTEGSKASRDFDNESEDSYSTASDNDQETADKENSEYIWNDVRRCRYLRGYDPPEMLLPRGEINLFVFGRDENDILEFKRTNERKIHAEVEDQDLSRVDDS